MAAPQPHTAALLAWCLWIAFIMLYPINLVPSTSRVRLSYYLGRIVLAVSELLHFS